MGELMVPYPDAYAQRILDSYWKLCSPPPPKEGQQQITRQQNVVRCLRESIKGVVLEAERRTVAEASAAALKAIEVDLA